MFRTPVQRGSALPGRVDVAILGGGLAGLATALRLQAAGLRTALLEAHGHVGGCAGYYRRRGFSFDVGATTLVDFEPGGVGDQLLREVGLGPVEGEALPGYVAWLPDRVVTLHRDPARWHAERLRAFGDTPAHRAFWSCLDRVAAAGWGATRAGIRLPLRGVRDVLADVRAVGLRRLPLARHLRDTLGAALDRYGLRGDVALVALLGMLVEDTVHSSVDGAPLINAALGVTIRGAGLTRHQGGMHGFLRRLVRHYRRLGGELRVGCRVDAVTGSAGAFQVRTPRGLIEAAQVVSALPAATTARVAAATGVRRRLGPYLDRDGDDLGGAVIAFLGLPEDEVAGQAFTHHQVLAEYGRRFGDGNNMFVSVSAPGDLDSAPAGHRAVMLSSHTELSTWEGLGPDEYARRKRAVGAALIGYARRVYPNLAAHPVVHQIGTPRTYEAFTLRPRGAVGGVHQTLRNANQRAIGRASGVRGLWLVGDSTWPGLGTVACALASGLVAEDVRREARRYARGPRGQLRGVGVRAVEPPVPPRVEPVSVR